MPPTPPKGSIPRAASKLIWSSPLSLTEAGNRSIYLWGGSLCKESMKPAKLQKASGGGIVKTRRWVVNAILSKFGFSHSPTKWAYLIARNKVATHDRRNFYQAIYSRRKLKIYLYSTFSAVNWRRTYMFHFYTFFVGFILKCVLLMCLHDISLKDHE
jgi:hypothetical protein